MFGKQRAQLRVCVSDVERFVQYERGVTVLLIVDRARAVASSVHSIVQSIWAIARTVASSMHSHTAHRCCAQLRNCVLCVERAHCVQHERAQPASGVGYYGRVAAAHVCDCAMHIRRAPLLAIHSARHLMCCTLCTPVVNWRRGSIAGGVYATGGGVVTSGNGVTALAQVS